MTKISWNNKIIAIEEYLTGAKGKQTVARKYEISPPLFRIMLVFTNYSVVKRY